jgi:multicomponent K+:H+ antiporter subunit D
VAPARTAFALLLAVFAFKAALLPLGFWLPHAYGAATAPVAALFAVLTKVGIYAILRLSTAGASRRRLDGGAARALADAGRARDRGRRHASACSSRSGLGVMVAHLLLLSTGMLAAAVAEGGPAMLAAMLYYLPHTDAGQCRALPARRPDRGGPRRGRRPASAHAPRPAAGTGSARPGWCSRSRSPACRRCRAFLGKMMLLSAAPGRPGGCRDLGDLHPVRLRRRPRHGARGSVVFWERPDLPAAAPHGAALGPALGLALMFVPLLVLGAAPLSAHARAVAEQVTARHAYLAAALPGPGPVVRERRP